MQIPPTTDDGFLENAQDWSQNLARLFAEQQAISLTALHWAIIEFARDFFQQYHYTPTQRFIVKHLQTLDPHASSITLKALFPDGPRQICLIAGLPKPARCV